MMLTLWYNKFVPAAVLSALAGTDHMIEDNRPMADTIMPRMIESQIAQYLNKGKNYLHRYECTECKDSFDATVSQVNKGKRLCNTCSMKHLAVKRRKHGHRSRVLHGAAGSGHWKAHHSMLGRCYDSRCNGYQNYGGRGIKVCDGWQTFEGFMKWDKFNDWKPGLQLDRIDNNGDYTPDNCQWVTLQENSQKRRSSVLDVETVRLMKIFYGSGVPLYLVDKMFGVYRGATSGIINQGRWSNA